MGGAGQMTFNSLAFFSERTKYGYVDRHRCYLRRRRYAMELKRLE